MLRLDRQIIKGNDEVIAGTVRNPDGSARNLVGERVEFVAKFEVDDPAPVVFKSSATGGISILPQGTNPGKVEVSIGANDLAAATYDGVLICALDHYDAAGRRSTTELEVPVRIAASS